MSAHWTHAEMDAIARQIRTNHYNGNNGDAMNAIEALPPIVAAYVGAYVLGTIDCEDSRDFWMRVMARRAETTERGRNESENND